MTKEQPVEVKILKPCCICGFGGRWLFKGKHYCREHVRSLDAK